MVSALSDDRSSEKEVLDAGKVNGGRTVIRSSGQALAYLSGL
jgi:hypothetical protein